MHRKLIAILRGVRPDEVVPIGSALVAAGITDIEVPLNSPDPFVSIQALAVELKGQGRFGAGTVLRVAEIDQLVAAKGDFVVSPNCNTDVIRATKSAGLGSYPGVFSPTECFAALEAGADALKIFPAGMMGPSGLAAIRAVLPPGTDVYAVGGAGPENFAEWAKASVDGFGLGSSLYKPGFSAEEVGKRAAESVAAYDAHLT